MTEEELIANAEANIQPVDIQETGQDPDEELELTDEMDVTNLNPPDSWGQDGEGDPGDVPGVENPDHD